ncbi:DUF2798 domain-containing protein [Fructilactobacillus cliffordii]|uniref:DUF2798 domain-containing protein n=1 Tax=Fructilactobacillus cliffordii TaxID=2940299 RepID=UPI002092B990|nr:DUF2798 domain-containing protein [Fructilactobacillus cliffordii]USS86117.1 DUF2798 domain-containing protein [Fructilactobacillus cliffordii]
MPKNWKEELFFTGMMAGLMVLGMTFYNIVKTDGFSSHVWSEVLAGYPLGLLVAVLLDLLLVGPLVKSVVFNFLIKDPANTSPIRIGMTISVLMVLGMVTCMSLFGLLMSADTPSNWGTAYLMTWSLNIIVALPLQLLLVGPISRFGLQKVQQQMD